MAEPAEPPPWLKHMKGRDPFHFLVPGRAPIVVDPTALRGRAGKAREAGRGVHAAAAQVRAAGHKAPAAGLGLASIDAAQAACTSWTATLARLGVAVDGFGETLVAAAGAYERGDAAAADLFAPARPTPVHHADGGDVAV